MNDFFSTSYAISRNKFCDRAEALGAAIRSYFLPDHYGPSGEALAIDVATIGPANAENTILILSGTHGIEGYAGAGCQLAIMNSPELMEACNDFSITFVHAVNPYGFAHYHRVNEKNVDLNRNSIDFTTPPPINRAYEAVMRPLSTLCDQICDYRAVANRFQAMCASDGLRPMLDALQPGQYSHPAGIFYGGDKYQWSTLQMQNIFQIALAGKKKAIAIDIHTGLGEPGVGEILLLIDGEQKRFSGLDMLFGPPVSRPGGAQSVAAEVNGPLISGICAAGESCDKLLGFALEFGTVPINEVLLAIIVDAMCMSNPDSGDGDKEEAMHMMLDAFYCVHKEGWTEKIVERTKDVFRSSVNILNA